MSDMNQLSLPTPFLFYSCAHFCLYGPFNCISIHKFSRQLSGFSLCSSGLISVSLVLSTIYLCMTVSLSPDIIPSGWLGYKKNQLANELTFSSRFSFLCFAEGSVKSLLRRRNRHILISRQNIMTLERNESWRKNRKRRKRWKRRGRKRQETTMEKGLNHKKI